MGEREANLALIGYGGAAVEICAGAFALGLALAFLIWGAW